jgi:hypothetical protein
VDSGMVGFLSVREGGAGAREPAGGDGPAGGCR